MAIRVDETDNGSSYRIGGTLAEINIIPLVDVTLVLLLIFMLTAPLMYRGIDVNLPKTAGKPTAVEERMVLTLTKEQTIYVNDNVGRWRSDLETLLAECTKEDAPGAPLARLMKRPDVAAPSATTREFRT